MDSLSRIGSGVVLLLWLAALGLAMTLMVFAEWRVGGTMSAAYHRLLDEARALAATVEIQDARALAMAAAEARIAAYRRLQVQFEDHARRMPDHGIRALVPVDGGYRLGPGTAAHDDAVAATAGARYRRPPPELDRLLAAREASVTRVYQDERGRFVTAFAPVLDPDDGRVLLFVGIDWSADDWGRQVLSARALPVGTGLFLMLLAALIMIGLVALLRERQSALKIALEGALRGRDANLDAIARTARDAIVMMDPQGRIRFWNPAAEQLFGYPRARAMGRDLHALLAPEVQQPQFRHRLPRFLRGDPGRMLGQTLRMEAVHRDGFLVPVELSLSSVEIDGGRYAVGILRDIRERLRAEERLLRLNASLSALGADYHANVNRITEVCGTLFGADAALYNRLDSGLLIAIGQWHTPPEMPDRDTPEGHLCFDLIRRERPAPSTDRGEQGLSQDVLLVKDLLASDYARTDPNVRAFGLQAYLGHVVRCEGEPVGSLCAVFKRHFTPTADEVRLLGILAAALSAEENRHAATRRLAESERRLSLATTGAGLGIWEVDRQTGALRWDARMYALFDVTPDTFGHQLTDWQALVLPEDRPGLIALRETVGEFRIECRVPIMGETPRHLICFGAPEPRADGWSGRILGVTLDISRLKEAEQELRLAKEEAERASAVKTEFLSRMTHELRTPLHAVLGFAQLLDGDPRLDAEHQENVREIIVGGRHLLTLIDEVLDLARMEAGRIELNPQSVHLLEVLDEALLAVREQAGQRGIEIAHGIDAHWRLRADRFRLRQVLVKLLSNAIKYNRPQGRIDIGVAAVPEWDGVRVSVRDTGVGIDPDYQQEVFNLFSRSPDHATGIGGAGIGLTVARQLIEQMGGEIGVESRLGEGSCFWFCLPQAGSGKVMEPALTPLLLSGQKTIDDD